MWVDELPRDVHQRQREARHARGLWNVSNQSPQHSIAAPEGGEFPVLLGGRIRARRGDVPVRRSRGVRCETTAAAVDKGPARARGDGFRVVQPGGREPGGVVLFDGTVRLWNARSLACVKTFHAVDAPRPSTLGGARVASAEAFGGGERGHAPGKGSMYTCAVSCDGAIVCGAGFEGDLYFFDVHSGCALPTRGHRAEARGNRAQARAHPTEPGAFERVAGTGGARRALLRRRVCDSAAPHAGGGRARPAGPARCWPPPRRAAGWACTSPNAGSCPSAGRRWLDRRDDDRGSPPPRGAQRQGVRRDVLSARARDRLLSVSDDATARAWTVREARGGRLCARRSRGAPRAHGQGARARLAPRAARRVLHRVLGRLHPRLGRRLGRVPAGHARAPGGRLRHRHAPRPPVPRGDVLARLHHALLEHGADGALGEAARGDGRRGTTRAPPAARRGLGRREGRARGTARRGTRETPADPTRDPRDRTRNPGGSSSPSRARWPARRSAAARRPRAAAAAPRRATSTRRSSPRSPGTPPRRSCGAWRASRQWARARRAGPRTTPPARWSRRTSARRAPSCARARTPPADAALAKPGSARGAGGERRRRGRGMRDAEALARADVWLRLGDFASYCEACVEMGDWNAAIAAARRGVPGVLGRHGGEARGGHRARGRRRRAGVADAPGGGQTRRRRRRAGGGGTRGRRLRRGVRGGRRRVPVAGSLGGGGGARGARSASADFGETGVSAERRKTPTRGTRRETRAALAPRRRERERARIPLAAPAAQGRGQDEDARRRRARRRGARDGNGESSRSSRRRGGSAFFSRETPFLRRPPRTSPRPRARCARRRRRGVSRTATPSARRRRASPSATRRARRRTLLRGAQVEMAAALMLSLPSGSFARAPEPLGLVGIAGGRARLTPRGLLRARVRAGRVGPGAGGGGGGGTPGGARGAAAVAATRAAGGPRGARAEGFPSGARAPLVAGTREETRVSPLGLVASKSLASALVGDVETVASLLVASAATSSPAPARRRAGTPPVCAGRWPRSLQAPPRPRSQRRPARPEDAWKSDDARCYLSAITLQSAGTRPRSARCSTTPEARSNRAKPFRASAPGGPEPLQELKSMAAVPPHRRSAEGLTEISTAAAVSPALRPPPARRWTTSPCAGTSTTRRRRRSPPPRSQTTTTAASTGGAPTRCRWRRAARRRLLGAGGGSPPIARSRRRCSLYVVSLVSRLIVSSSGRHRLVDRERHRGGLQAVADPGPVRPARFGSASRNAASSASAEGADTEAHLARTRAPRALPSTCATTGRAGGAWWPRRTSRPWRPGPASAPFGLPVPVNAGSGRGRRWPRGASCQSDEAWEDGGERAPHTRDAAACGSAPSGARRARWTADTPRSARHRARTKKSTPARTPPFRPVLRGQSALRASAPEDSPRLPSRRDEALHGAPLVPTVGDKADYGARHADAARGVLLGDIARRGRGRTVASPRRVPSGSFRSR